MSESIWEDPRITTYAMGEMSDQERLDFEDEMASNSELAAAVEEARAVTGQLASWFGDESIPPLDATRRESIVAAPVSTPDQAPDQGTGLPWSRIGWVVACAAGLLLVLGVLPATYMARQASHMAQQSEYSQQAMQALDIERSSALSAESRTLAESADESIRLKSLTTSSGLSVDELADRPEVSAEPRYVLPLANLSQTEVQARGRVSTRDASGQSADSYAFVPPDQFSAGPATQPQSARFSRQPTTSDALPPSGSGAAPTASLEFVKEGGTVVLSGRRADVAKIDAIMEQRERVSESLRSEAEILSRQATEFRAAQDQKQIAAGLAENARLRKQPQTTNEAIVDYRITGGGRFAGKGATRLSTAVTGTAGTNRVGQELRGGTVLTYESQLARQESKFGLLAEEARRPGIGGDRFEPITDNPFRRTSEHPLSTFSVDVDTASYSKVRDYLARANQLPRPDAVRIEELVNYFSYGYEPPEDSAEHPFAVRASVTSCPWNEQHRLARIAVKGKTMEPEERPRCNLVFLLDTSGSMKSSNKLPLVIEGMRMLLKQLNDDDRVAITVYAGSAGLVLDSTAAKKGKKIRKALTQLSAGGSTNGGAGIALAYQTARDHFIDDGVNRVILCTDGDFNVGTTGTTELVRLVEREAKGGVFLSVLGFGMGNHNDSMLEQISGRGNGNYAFIDNRQEARKVLVEQTNSTLVTIAKDVKLQVDFNISQVSSYRLIGYANRILAKEDFVNDKIDAAEIGAGHAVTALYEIVPAGSEEDPDSPKSDGSKYQLPAQPSEAAESGELITVKVRYKQPDGDDSIPFDFPVFDQEQQFEDADDDVRFAAAVASFGMQLRGSTHAGSWTLSDVMNTANRAKGEDPHGLRAEFVTLVQKASELMGEE